MIFPDLLKSEGFKGLNLRISATLKPF